MSLHQRELAWEGCLNVRDLGGHPLDGGGETRYGAVVRADSIRQLTDAGWEALFAYGVRTVVDLRGHHELEDDPPRELPLEVIHVPFMEADESEWEELGPEIDRVSRAAPDIPSSTRDVYLLFLEHFRGNVAAGIRAVAHAQEGPVVVHCVGGKDRTGLLTAFLLQLAGVPTEEIAADYALSEERLRPRHDRWLDEAASDEDRERLARITRTPAESIVGVFEELERRYGSVEGYLRAAGLDEGDLELARRRLVDG